eukprot:Opistho-2@54808
MLAASVLRASRAGAQRAMGALFQPMGIQVRNLNLHEYQSKELMEKHGVTTQRFKVANTPGEALGAAKWVMNDIKAKEIVLKAQIHAGGRGKGTFSPDFRAESSLLRIPRKWSSWPAGCLVTN